MPMRKSSSSTVRGNLPRDRPLRLVIQLSPEQAKVALDRGLETAFANFFAYRASRIELQLRELFRNGRRHLAVGLPVLVACLLASQYAARQFEHQAWGKVIEESLIILGWVANWRPIELFLYDWWPIRRDLVLYRRLAAANVVIDGERGLLRRRQLDRHQTHFRPGVAASDRLAALWRSSRWRHSCRDRHGLVDRGNGTRHERDPPSGATVCRERSRP